ncbi:hypothetical protein GCM10022202_20200 [Microbacterium marinilacus]|uniref:Uncharacterized protein n=1 Tax=Microbacterium marinilacus TaxID=415209 RepID=A0ABP7BFR9_9MICO
MGIGQLVPGARQVEHGHAEQTLVRSERVPEGQPDAVGDEQHVRPGGVHPGLEAPPVEHVSDEPLDVGPRLADPARRPHGVALALRLHVGQPLGPLPVRQVVGRREHADLQLLGGDERGEVRDHRSRQTARRPLGPGDLDARVGGDVDGVRQCRLVLVRQDEAVRGGRADRVELRERGDRGLLQVEGERLGRGADPDHQQVGLVGQPLPHA